MARRRRRARFVRLNHATWYQARPDNSVSVKPHDDWTHVLRCSVSCDHIPRRSWALFRARDVMRGVIESFKAEQAA